MLWTVERISTSLFSGRLAISHAHVCCVYLHIICEPAVKSCFQRPIHHCATYAVESTEVYCGGLLKACCCNFADWISSFTCLETYFADIITPVNDWIHPSKCGFHHTDLIKVIALDIYIFPEPQDL